PGFLYKVLRPLLRRSYPRSNGKPALRGQRRAVGNRHVLAGPVQIEGAPVNTRNPPRAAHRRTVVPMARSVGYQRPRALVHLPVTHKRLPGGQRREAPGLRPGALTRRVHRAHAPLVARARRKAAHLRGGTRYLPVENHSARTPHGGHLHAVPRGTLDRLPAQNRRKRNAHRARRRRNQHRGLWKIYWSIFGGEASHCRPVTASGRIYSSYPPIISFIVAKPRQKS